jgi:hypothetical protein
MTSEKTISSVVSPVTVIALLITSIFSVTCALGQTNAGSSPNNRQILSSNIIQKTGMQD